MMGRRLTSCSLIAVAMAAVSLGLHAQRPASGDLEGLWNYATMTPLERPRDLAAKASLGPAEAAEYERLTIERQAATNNTAGPDWWDPGTRFLTGGRTSLIVDPADGRIPALTSEAQQRAAARTRARRRTGGSRLERTLPELGGGRSADAARRLQQQRADHPDPRLRGDRLRDDPRRANRADGRARAR